MRIRSNRTPLRLNRAPVLAAAACLVFSAAPAVVAELPEPVLEGFYEHWLAAVSQRMTDAERRAFSALSGDREREVFIRRFWQARAPAGGRHRELERWHQSFEEARHRFGDLENDRAQALLLAGKPARVVVFAGCRNVIRPLRLWTFDRRPATQAPEGAPEASTEDDGFYLVFYRESSDGAYHHWTPGDGAGPLMWAGPARDRAWTLDELIAYASAKDCFRWQRRETTTFAAALRRAVSPDELRRRTLPAPPDGAWLEALRDDLAAGAALPSDSLEFEFPGRYQMKTVVHGRVAIPVEEVERNASGLLFDRVVIVGDVTQGDRRVDSFRVVHLVAGAEPATAAVDLDFYRRLRPGDYTLDLRVEDRSGLGLLRQTRPLRVPGLEQRAPPPAGHRQGLPGLTRAEVGVLTTFPSVELLPPDEGLLVGEVEVGAATTGGPIERIDFLLDGAAAATDGAPPYSATVRLADAPRRHRLEAIAFDPAGREIARDAVTLNAGPPRFAVRLTEPRSGTNGKRATVEVDVPRGETLESVELFVDRERIATLREAPFVHPLPERPAGAATYVRAVATLESGASMEDLVFVGSPDATDRIDVRLVELYTSVSGGDGRFVTGLVADDFRVLENGARQTVRRFDTVTNLAINVALLMDVSASMRPKLAFATKSALAFFETVVTDKDRASLLTFNHDIRRPVPFTADVSDLRHGASGFRAWGTTRLHDSIVYAAHSFGGLTGKRALVLLSDGHDVDSDFTFRQVLEATLRAGVAVYPIALGVEDSQTVTDLGRLAGESGGRFFRVAAVSELPEVYRRIEDELRSQYLLVYEPPPGGRTFRRVEVEVLRDGLRARSIHGYYP